MDGKLPISLCMIVKNEEEFLDVALKSVRTVLDLDDIIVVDTGSTDRTKEIVTDNIADVFDFKWCDDFSAARNFATSKAKHDWILYIDADEELVKVDLDDLRKFLTNEKSIGMITLTDMLTKRQSSLARLFNRRYYSFQGNIHEQLRAIDSRQDFVTTMLSINLHHHGYLPEYNKVKAKLERNEQLLLIELDKQPDNPYLLYQLGMSYFCNDRDLSKACSYFEKAISVGVDPRVGYTYNLVECYGYALINTGQLEEALALRDRYSIYYNNNVQFRFLSAHIYQNNGMFVEAVESYESCISADIHNTSGITSFLSYYNIGVILECIEMLEDALVMYKKCGDYEPAKQRLEELLR